MSVVTFIPEDIDAADIDEATSVADLTALAAQTGMTVGARRYVIALADTYTLKSGAYTPDALTVIAAVGGGYWIADLAGRWDDLDGDVSQGTANAALTYEVYRDTGFLMYFFRSGQTDQLCMRFQLSHGTDVSVATGRFVPHLHVVPMVAPTPGTLNVAFSGAYCWARNGVVVPAVTGWTSIPKFAYPITVGSEFKPALVPLATIIAPTGLKGSDILLVNIQRLGGDGTDTYTTNKSGPGTATANLGLLSLDVHYRKASFGSVTEIPA